MHQSLLQSSAGDLERIMVTSEGQNQSPTSDAYNKSTFREDDADRTGLCLRCGGKTNRSHQTQNGRACQRLKFFLRQISPFFIFAKQRRSACLLGSICASRLEYSIRPSWRVRKLSLVRSRLRRRYSESVTKRQSQAQGQCEWICSDRAGQGRDRAPRQVVLQANSAPFLRSAS